MRAMGPAAGWRWLKRGINLGHNNPRAVFGAVVLLILTALVPSIVQLIVLGLGMTGDLANYALIGLSLLYSVLVMPPLLGGLMRVIHASEQGRAVRAMAIFDVFKHSKDAVRMIIVSAVLTFAATAVIGLIVATFGPGVPDWYAQVAAASQQAPVPGAAKFPPLPEGFGTVAGLTILFGLFIYGAYAIAFGQVALTDRSAGGALTDGLVGALKNLLPLVVLLLAWLVFAFALMLIVGLLATLLRALGNLVDPALGVALAAPVYMALILVIYSVIFGVMYHLWRDVAGGAPTGDGGGDSVVAA